jgi:hypothetical protein
MQAGADGVYPDQSMIVVIIPTAAADVATEVAGNAYMEQTAESAAKGLLGLIGSTCGDIANGGSMTPATGGSCYTLNVGAGIDSEFDIVTTGLAGVTVFAQHVPVEFERDVHYFYDSAATPLMIEPVAESAHDVGHSHGPSPSPPPAAAASGASIATAVATIVAAGGAAALL